MEDEPRINCAFFLPVVELKSQIAVAVWQYKLRL